TRTPDPPGDRPFSQVGVPPAVLEVNAASAGRGVIVARREKRGLRAAGRVRVKGDVIPTVRGPARGVLTRPPRPPAWRKPAMLRLCGPGTRLCDGLTRREFLRVGGLGLAGLTLPGLLHAGPAAARARSVIQLFMWGGPSQHETFDLKPHAPEGVRGLFRP